MKNAAEDLTPASATADLASSPLGTMTHGKFVVIVGTLFSASVAGFISLFHLPNPAIAQALLVGGIGAEIVWLVLKFRASYLFDPATGRPRMLAHAIMAFVVLFGLAQRIQSLGRAWWPSPGGQEVVDLIAKGFLVSGGLVYFLFLQEASKTKREAVPEEEATAIRAPRV